MAQNVLNATKMALNGSFTKKKEELQKLPSGCWFCPQTPVCDAFEIHQFAQHDSR